jgi:BA14K-like protein
MTITSKVLAVALMTAAAPLLILSATAAPMSSPLMLRDAVAPAAETVQFRGARAGGGYRGGRAAGFHGAGAGAFRGGYRGGYGGRGFGGLALGAGIAGAVVGGALLAQPYGYGYQPYGYGYQSYGYDPGYDGDLVVAPVAGVGGGVAYCMQRYRSYDPGSGTFLGNDGLRHRCP